MILATAPGMQMKIYHDPPLPPMRNQLIQRVPMGCVIKMHLYYEKAHWIESGKLNKRYFSTTLTVTLSTKEQQSTNILPFRHVRFEHDNGRGVGASGYLYSG